MKKPEDDLMRLAELGSIRGIIIDYRQTGTDTADTYCELLGDGKKKVCGLWRTYRGYLDVSVGHCSAARIQPHLRKQIDDWRRFEKENAKELAEYERLKSKFDPE